MAEERNKEKHLITEEELDFLIGLQQELNTQDTVSQADPRFWVVAGTQKVCVGKEYAEGEQLIHDVDVVADELAGAVQYFQEILEEEADDYAEKGIKILIEKENYSFESYRVAKIDTSVDVNAEGYHDQDEIIMEQNVISGIDELIEALTDAGAIEEDDNYDIGYYRNEHYRYPDTMFITNKSCKQHIEVNHYHYSEDAHSYAMTAWRSPEVSYLWDILQKVDWKAMKEVVHDRTDANAGSGSSE